LYIITLKIQDQEHKNSLEKLMQVNSCSHFRITRIGGRAGYRAMFPNEKREF